MKPDDDNKTPTTKPRAKRLRSSVTERTVEGITGLISGTMNLFPTLSADDRAELRTAAYPILKAARTAAGHVQALTMQTPPQGFYQGAIVSTVSAFSAMASGLCLLGATIALVASATDEEASPPAAKGPPASPAATTAPSPAATTDPAPAPADAPAAQPDTTTKETR